MHKELKKRLLLLIHSIQSSPSTLQAQMHRFMLPGVCTLISKCCPAIHEGWTTYGTCYECTIMPVYWAHKRHMSSHQ